MHTLKFFVLLMLALELQIHIACNTENELKLIVDVVNSYETPTAVIAKGCWNARQKNNLTNMLSKTKNSNPKTLRFVEEPSGISNRMPRNHQTIIVVELKCFGSNEFLKYANDSKMFRYSQRWLIIGGYMNEVDVVPTEFQDLDILLDSEVTITRDVGESEFELYSIYRTNHLGWISEYFGTWTNIVGLQKSISMTTSTFLRRKNLGKEPIPITFALTVPINSYLDLEDLTHGPNSPAIHGYRYTAMICDFINATRTLIFTDTWGYFVNGSWSGQIGNIVRGEAELIGCPMFFSLDRLDVLYYITNTVTSGLKFVFREPPLSYQNNLFILPFGTGVWICSAGFVVLLLVILYINSYWESKVLENDGQNQARQNAKPNFSDMTMLVISAIAQQGSSIELKGTVGRLVVFILFMVFLFLYTSYSANIVALLQSSSKQIRTLKDLLESRLELGSEDTSYNRYHFKAATDPVRKAIYETKMASKNSFMTVEEGVKKLQTRPFGFNMHLGAGYRVVEKLFHEHEKCGLQEIEFIPLQSPWATCKKDSPYAQLYKLSGYRIREFGLNSQLNSKLFSTKPICQSSRGSFASVNLVDVYPLLLMLLYGALLAFALLLLEILAHRWEMRQRQKATQPEVTDIS